MKLQPWLIVALVTACSSSSTSTPDAGHLEDATADAAPVVDADALDAPDAPPPRPACDTAGEVRLAPCGFCGEGQETCIDGLWQPTSECFSEGECAPGSVDRIEGSQCDVQERLCNATCEWGPATERVPPGECAPGEERNSSCEDPAFERMERCSVSCSWEPVSDCASACGDLRTGGLDEDEICIPAGPFIRGLGSTRLLGPMGEVPMSTYAIDRYPVTNRRYRQCRTAGACTRTLTADSEASLADPAKARFAARAPWEAAREFCEWDGRRLATQAQLEKAARGPAPRAERYPWDGPYRCDYVLINSCPGWMAQEEAEVGANPNADGWYGIADVVSTRRQWAFDWFDPDYYFAEASRMRDPTGPASGTSRTAVWQLAANEEVAVVSEREPFNPVNNLSFRCTRVVAEGE